MFPKSLTQGLHIPEHRTPDWGAAAGEQRSLSHKQNRLRFLHMEAVRSARTKLESAQSSMREAPWGCAQQQERLETTCEGSCGIQFCHGDSLPHRTRWTHLAGLNIFIGACVYIQHITHHIYYLFSEPFEDVEGMAVLYS